MGYCKLTFYKMPIMTKEKNFIIEDFESYLSTLTKITISDEIKYFPPSLNYELKLNAKSGYEMQTQLMMKDSSASNYAYYNYLRVEFWVHDPDEDTDAQTDQKPCYYFIDNWEWRAENTARIQLTLDVLNMIGVPAAANKYCNWDDRTLIQRQHTKRYFTDSGTNYWKIDKKSEGLIGEQYLKESRVIYDSDYSKVKWNLVFSNALTDFQAQDNYVQLYLVPDSTVSVVDKIDPLNPHTYSVYGYYSNDWTSKAIDPKIIKIVQVPYLPTDDIVQTGDAAFEFSSSNYRVQNNMIEVMNINSFFDNTITTKYRIGASSYRDDIKDTINSVLSAQQNYLNSNAGRRIETEPKIFHSDYYINKFVYDDVSKAIKMENCDLSKNGQYTIDYIVSNNLASKILFYLNIPCFTDKQQDFENAMVSSRDNSRMQYNYAYYNYKISQEGWDQYRMQSGMMFTTLKSIVPGLIGDNGIQLPGAINSIINVAQQYVNGETSIENTISRLKNQAISVSGANDLAMFDKYSGNTLQRNIYEVSSGFKSIIWDLFYYNGYIINEKGVPETASRYWFNYIQCEPKFKNKLLNLVPGVWEAYEQKWREGTTIFHHHAIPKGYNVTKSWCLEQDLENLESDLL